MECKKKAVMCVVLVMVVVSSSSVPIVKNDTTIVTGNPKLREDKLSRYRLPNNTIPHMYNIYIEPNMDDKIFTWIGKISIDIEIIDPTLLLTLHASNNLVVDKNFTELVGTNRTKFSPVKHHRDNELEFLKLQFGHEIPAGNYSLNLKYKGTDTLEFFGFYKASNRNMPMVAATLFEATGARHAFPCWDEPALKARFRVSIKHFGNYTAVSNMPEIEHVETPDGKILTTFDTTPIMSTYLVNFVIAGYENVFNEHRNVSLHSSNSSLEKARHLLDLSPKVVEVMESYTGLPYGCPRIGSVLIPLFSTPALEHWGLVSYSEEEVKLNGVLDSTLQKDKSDMLIAHELAHSWFGNRVTPVWWDDLWLNEAFANYFPYYIMDKIYGNWNGTELFIVTNNQEATFPLDNGDQMPVKWIPITSEEIDLLFDPITYVKGAAIVHMFRNILSDDVFQVGIQRFMAKYSFRAAVSEDWITVFQEAYNESPNKDKPLNLKKTLTPWLMQKGYPIVNVTRNYTTGDTEVSQKSTLINDSSKKWWIPLTYATKSNTNFTSTLPVSWISDKEDRVKISGIDNDDWIILNIRATGYYRVNYDDENWKRLVDYLNTDSYKNIHVLNRAQLINDAFYLAQYEPNRYFRNFINLTRYLSREVEYLPWRSAYNAIKHIDEELLMPNTETHKMFVSYVLELMHSFIEKIDFEVRDTDDHFTKLSRTDIIQWACIAGHSECSEYAAQKVIKLAEDPVKNRLHPDITGWAFCAGLRGLNHTTAAKQFADWAYEHERHLLIHSVGCTENHEIHRNILNTSMAKNISAHVYDGYRAFRMLLMSTDENYNFAVDFFLENHQAMDNSLRDHGMTDAASNIMYTICEHVKSRARLEKFKEVLLSDAVHGYPRINKTLLLALAELTVAKADASAALFQTWLR